MRKSGEGTTAPVTVRRHPETRLGRILHRLPQRFGIVGALSLLFLLLSSGVSLAQRPLSKEEAINLGQSAEKGSSGSYKRLRRLAASGDLWSEIVLGDYYARRKKGTADEKKAFFWYMKAARQGSPDGETDIGAAYFYGQGVGADYLLARDWFEKAARQGFVNGENWMGTLYASGLGVSKDIPQALIWYKRAALHGDAGAATNIGVIYQEGLSGEKDFSRARKWFSRGVSGHDPQAIALLGSMYKYGQGVPRDFSRAVSYYRQAAALGSVVAAYGLGICYAQGQGVRKDPVQAYAWLSRVVKAARPGSKTSMVVQRELSYLSRNMSSDQIDRAKTLSTTLP